MGWIWVFVPLVAIAAPLAYKAFSQWVDYKKASIGALPAPELESRLTAGEETMADMQRRIGELESVVSTRLLGMPEGRVEALDPNAPTEFQVDA